MEKLTTKQLTKIVNTQHAHIQAIMTTVSDYIEFKGDKEEFSEVLNAKYSKKKESLKEED